MPHVRELGDLEAVAEHGLAQAARLHVDVVLGRGHEHLPAVSLIIGDIWISCQENVDLTSTVSVYPFMTKQAKQGDTSAR